MLLVIHAHIGDDRHQRRDHVGCIQPAAHSHFQHNEIGLLLGEPEQSQGGCAFKIRDLAAIQHRFNPACQTGEVFLADICAVDLKTLPHRAEMGRSVQAGLVSCGGKHGMQGRADRTFAVCACDMDAAQLLLRIAEPGKKMLHGIQPQLDLEKLELVEKLLRLLIVHCSAKGKGCAESAPSRMMLLKTQPFILL